MEDSLRVKQHIRDMLKVATAARRVQWTLPQSLMLSWQLDVDFPEKIERAGTRAAVVFSLI